MTEPSCKKLHQEPMPYFKSFEIGHYLNAEVVRVLPKTVIMNIQNKHHGYLLGQVRWFPNWRQYCFKIGDEWFSESCLRDIADFLKRTNNMHKALKKKELPIAENSR